MRLPILILAALPGAGLAEEPKHSGAGPDCFCTDTVGARVELGESICLYVNGRAYLARCEMVLNNPAWRDTGEACVSSSLINKLNAMGDRPS